MNLVKLTIDGKTVEVPEGTRVLKAAEKVGIKIPTLCYLKDIHEQGICRICVVEVEGRPNLLASCILEATDGMAVKTRSKAVLRARKTALELILANHVRDCLNCDRSTNCELQTLAYQLGADADHYHVDMKERVIDRSSPSIVRDTGKCILCRRCVTVCQEMQTVSAIGIQERGFQSVVSPAFSDLGHSVCVNCGQCALVCPTAAIVEQSHIEPVWAAIHDPDKVVVVQTAPAIRVGLGEAMGMPYGSLVTGKMVAGLRRLGFQKVFDTQFTADLTIMEEGNELIQRIQNKGTLPMITSCSPGWIKFIEHFYPKSLGHLSSCKSPQQMFGAVAKTYYAEKMGIDPRKMVVVSIMPCTAKKFEAGRQEMNSSFEYWKDKMNLSENEAFFDVDYALTTRELGRMLSEIGVDFSQLPDEEFDSPLGASTGAAVIFGATGGVMEAAVRTAYEVLTGKPLQSIDLAAVRGMDGVKTAEVDVAGTKIKVAVANGLKNARILLDEIEEGKSPYAFIEVMTCPGGCLGGGGQPIPTNLEIRKKRAESIYREDFSKGLRKSHENPEVLQLYKDFLIEPLGEKSHHLLHTHYTPRGVYKI